MLFRIHTVLLLPLFVSVLAVDARAATITTCGETVTGKGALAADLDCSGQAAFGVILSPGATLDLNGFTLHDSTADAVWCDGSCKVVSSVPGGKITGAGGNGINANGTGVVGGNVSVTGVTISGNGLDGIAAAGRVKITDSVLSDNGNDGVDSSRGGKIKGSVVARNAGFGLARYSGNWRVDECVIEDNGLVALGAFNAKVMSSTIQRNSVGAAATFLTVKDSTIVDNTLIGVRAYDPGTASHLTVRGSTVTGNGTDPGCSSGSECGDVGASSRPNVKDTTCGTSYNPGAPGASWGVCSLDP